MSHVFWDSLQINLITVLQRNTIAPFEYIFEYEPLLHSRENLPLSYYISQSRSLNLSKLLRNRRRLPPALDILGKNVLSLKKLIPRLKFTPPHPISLQPDRVNFHFKLWLFERTEIIVWNKYHRSTTSDIGSRILWCEPSDQLL